MRFVLRPSIVVSLCVALCLGIGGTPAGAARRGEPSRWELQRRADRAAAAHERAVATLSRLAVEIGRLQRKIGDAEARMAPLRASVTRRAVAVYTSDPGLTALAGFADDPVGSARAAKLVAGASDRDHAAIRAIADASAELTRRRDELDRRREQRQQAADDLEAEHGALALALASAVRRDRALQSRLVRRADRGERVPAAAAPGAIPVATDFVCPIRGPMAFVDSWGAPRPGGRRHAGTDLMSPQGTENVAVVSGSFETHRSAAGGLAIYLHGDDGHTYYYAHLSQVVGPDRRVARGEVIGRTGSTGNASSPHTHFEFHPDGGGAVNSYPLLRAHC